MGFHVVTGAYGFAGKYITARLLAAGKEVRTLTGSPDRANPFAGKVAAMPYNFHRPEKLVASLRGADVLYNTYWVRFNHGEMSFQLAIDNTRKLLWAAQQAGVRRFVHLSITNPSSRSKLEYFSGKARLEQALRDSSLSYAVLRPAVLFGKEGILLNNIAWLLRRFPVFGLFGDGSYRLQPIAVEDLAELAVKAGARSEIETIDAIGPETFTYRDLVKLIGTEIGKKRLLVPMPALVGYGASLIIGRMQGDVLLTRDEISGLMQGRLVTKSKPVGTTRLSDWIKASSSTLGLTYASELARRRNRRAAYADL